MKRLFLLTLAMILGLPFSLTACAAAPEAAANETTETPTAREVNADTMKTVEEINIPQAAAVVMQYTGHSETSRADAPTYACVGTSDGIADWRTMQSRLQTLQSYGIPTGFHAYNGLSHGFGLGTGTVAEGWINDAVAFWEANQ